MIAKKPFNIRPDFLYLVIMIIQFLILLTVLFPISNSMVFLLFLSLVFSIILRWRIDLKPAYMVIDQTLFIIISIFYPIAAMYLFIFAYYFAYKNKLIYIIPSMIAGGMIIGNNFYILLLQAVLLGILLHYWEKESSTSKNIVDHLRQRIYDLELVQSHLLSDYQDTERISRLTERQRIAEILHDDLGHELTAAHLSLRAYKTLLESNNLGKADETLKKVEERLENALAQLKDSVKHIEPNLDTGLNQLNDLCENFMYPVDFSHSGHILKVKPYIWQLILMSVKEAFTNITKHARPSKIQVTLDVTDFIVSLTIENDGILNNEDRINGNGLRYMRSRLEAVNGSLSIQKKNTFKLIIIIPIRDGR